MNRHSTRHLLTRARSRLWPLALAGYALFFAQSCSTPPSLPVANALQEEPNLQAAVRLYYEGEFERSIEMLRRVVRTHQGDSPAKWELVSQYEEAGDYAAASAVLRGLLDAEPDRARPALFTAAVLSGDLAAAQEVLPSAAASSRLLLYEAVYYNERGMPKRAKQLAEDSIAKDEHEPAAWYLLGILRANEGRAHEAEIAFRTVLAQDPDLTVALPPLAESILAQGDYRRAYPLLLRVRNILPNNQQVVRTIERLRREHPELEERSQAAREKNIHDTVPPTVATFPPSAVAERPRIRVGLAEGLRSITIKAGGDFTIVSDSNGGSPVFRGTKGEVLVLKVLDGRITLYGSDGAAEASWEHPATLGYENRSDTTVVFDLVTERGSFYATRGNRSYRGTMEFRPDRTGITVINTLPLEEYLYSVLPSEMPGSWPQEALKAQAVAARSYTLASLGRFSSRGYDVRGSVVSAAYGGVGSEYAATTRAVNATEGQILIHDSKPLQAFYSANSGGYTEDSRVVWGEAAGMDAVPDLLTRWREHYLPLYRLVTWLRESPPSYSAVYPYYSRSAYRWMKWVPAAEIGRLVRGTKDIGTVTGLRTRGRGVSGRVERVEVTGTKGSIVLRGDRIRYMLGRLRSTLFTVRPWLGPGGLPRYFIFTGGGWGHGVGMDQSGAAGMAHSGYTYREILAHYYPLARIGSDRIEGSAAN